MAGAVKRRARPVGRPVKTLTHDQVEQLKGMALIGATQVEMAWAMKMDVETLVRCIRDNYSVEQLLKATNAALKMSLRRKQISIAMDDTHPGQVTMLVWCGKTVLGQSDRISLKFESADDAMAKLLTMYPELTPDGVRALIGDGSGDDAH